MFDISLARSDGDIGSCYEVMAQLCSLSHRDGFVAQIRRQEKEGYQLALLRTGDHVRGAAGFKVFETLSWGRILFLDDLVVDQPHRGKGYGRALIGWLCDYGHRAGCKELHLDSGTARTDAHRLYVREGLAITCFHFTRRLYPNGPNRGGSNG